MQQGNWDDLRIVLAIWRAGSLAAAARALKVNQTTVTRRLEHLEGRLGAQLFQRGRGTLEATEAGLDLTAHAERMEREVLAAEAKLSALDQKAAGTVRLTSVPIIINHLLVPALAELLEAHPELNLELVAEPKALSLTKREADFAIRLARPSQEAPVLAQKVGELAYGAYGPAKAGAGDLPWIVYEEEMAHLPHAKWLAARAGSGPAPVAVNDAQTILALVAAGQGRSLLPVCVAERVKGLRALEVEPAPPAREVWLLSHPDHKSLHRMQVVAAWAKSALARALA